MRSRWGRWHGYMDELEEAMRIAGQHLREVEKLLSNAYERKTWKGAKRDSADKEIIRRAVDIPASDARLWRSVSHSACRLAASSRAIASASRAICFARAFAAAAAAAAEGSRAAVAR